MGESMTGNRLLRSDLAAVATDLKGHLCYLKQLGFSTVPVSNKTLALLDAIDELGCEDSLDTIAQEASQCQRCRLCEGRKHVVFGQGNPKARLVLVGEGPGYEEDQRGLPFVGPAGRLLTKILAAIHLSRDDVYICNIIKCRPPHNRNPRPDEIAACLPFLERQIRAINPKLICALGTIAAQTLLQTDTAISRLRGVFHPYADISVMPTYHPAFLLRNPERKRDVWNDVQKLQAEYEKY